MAGIQTHRRTASGLWVPDEPPLEPSVDLTQCAWAIEGWNPGNAGLFAVDSSGHHPPAPGSQYAPLTPNRANGLPSWLFEDNPGRIANISAPVCAPANVEMTVFTVFRPTVDTDVYLYIIQKAASNPGGDYLYTFVNGDGYPTWYVRGGDSIGPQIDVPLNSICVLEHDYWVGGAGRVWVNGVIPAGGSGLLYYPQGHYGGFVGNQQNVFQLIGDLFAHYVYIGRMPDAYRAQLRAYLKFKLALSF